jgi:cyclopropane fatty-acyl-phospholipid synthase-like methyltransferase
MRTRVNRLRAALGRWLEERLALMAPSRRLRLALAEEKLAEQAGARPIGVLDAGCGDGLLSLAIAERHPGWRVVGVDLRAETLIAATDRARERGLANVRFLPADLTEAVPESGFDAVLAIECLSEIPDDRAAIGAMSASLAAGGVLIVQAPEASWKPVLKSSAPVWREQVRQGYTAAELGERLEAAGLELLEIEPTYRSMAALAQEIRDRIKGASPALRALAFPAMAAAVRLERRGITWGRPSALIAVAQKPAADN